jgi:predicted secreted protein
MEKLTVEQITELQKQYQMIDMQEKINSGLCWKLEGSYGRAAMALLESGACMLPEKQHKDYYGNIVPSRNDLQEGTKGTLLNSQRFWEMVENGEIEIDLEVDVDDQ